MDNRNSKLFTGFNWQTILVSAGIAFLAPYVIRRLMPLFQGRVGDLSANDVSLAGKDSVRDVADDLNVGGASGAIDRTIDRVTDRITH